MKVHVRFRPRKQDDRAVDLPSGATVRDLLVAVGEPVINTLVVRAGDPIPDSAPLVDGEELLILSAASGG